MSSISSPIKGRAWTRDPPSACKLRITIPPITRTSTERSREDGGCCFIICSAYMQGAVGTPGRVWKELKGSGELGGGAAELISGAAPGFICPEAAPLQADSQAKDAEFVCQLSFLSPQSTRREFHTKKSKLERRASRGYVIKVKNILQAPGNGGQMRLYPGPLGP